MSESKTLADVLKCSPEVTSLSSDDRLLAVDANGNHKRILRDNLYAEVDVVQFEAKAGIWYRIATTKNNKACAGSIMVVTDPASQEAHIFTFCSGLAAQFNTKNMSIRSCSNRGIVAKARVFVPSSSGYSMYLAILLTEDRMVTVRKSGCINIALTPMVETQTTGVEFDLISSISGGVKRYASISCKQQQKGGQPDGGSDNTDRGIVEEPVADRFGGQRRMYEYRFGYDPRDIYDFCRYHGNFPCKDGSLRPLWQTYCLPEAKRQYIPDAHRRKRRNGNQSLLQRFMAALERASVPVALGKEVAA